MSNYDDNDDEMEERGFLQRHRIAFAIGGIVLIAAAGYAVKNMGSGSGSSQRHAQEIVSVRLPPPPPPPPPPPKVEQPKEEPKMMEQAPVDAPEDKPEDKPAPPQPDVGTGIKGNGPDSFGLSSRGGGQSFGGNGRGGPRSPFGWYAGQVQSQISAALLKNRLTRNANLRLKVRIWADITGRVTRAKLAESSGDAALDKALQDEVLTGLQLQEAPPKEMPMPIVLRLTARRPN